MKRPRQLRKVFIVVLLLLLGGAIVNVAVAWGCAAFVPIVTKASQTSMRSDETDGWAVKRWRSPGIEFVQSMRTTLLATSPGRGGLPKRGGDPTELLSKHGSFLPHLEYVSGSRKSDDRAIASSGWPLLTLWCEYELWGAEAVAVYGH